MGGKGSAPAAPDYVGAAQQQAAASREVTDVQNWANRPTINTPFGSQSWGAQAALDPATGKPVTMWTQNTTLAPGLQQALDYQLGTQIGRSQLANGFMGRVADEYAQPFDYANLPRMAQANMPGSLQTGTADYTPGLDTDVNNRTGNLTSGFSMAGPQMSMSPMTNNLVNSVAQTPVNSNFNGMTGDLRRGTGTESLQRSLTTGDNPALPQFDSGFRDQVATQLMTRMQPVHDYQRQQLETRLANQGFDIGSEGYKRALDELNQRQAAERFNALDQSGAEAQRLYGMQMGSRQQAFNEDVTGGNFFNQAANQAFNQGLSANQFANQATGQAFNQAMQAQQAGNQALGQQFNQALGAGQFQNQAANQAFNQTLGAFNFGNNAQQQAYNQMLGQANLNNQAQQQAFNQDLQASQFQNQALGQASALDLARMQAQNQAMQQQYGLNQQFADAQNRLRQQAIAEQMQRRGMSLNEMNALLSGQQVSMPQMPSFVAAQRSETPNILGATQMGYDAQLGAYNAQQAGFGNLLGAGAQLGSAAFMFSDRRLKSGIKRVGTHAIGVGIYDYTMMGMPQRGVIAQEVERVRPDLVKRHANGYLMVNYGGL
jgi:hypothetical protein